MKILILGLLAEQSEFIKKLMQFYKRVMLHLLAERRLSAFEEDKGRMRSAVAN